MSSILVLDDGNNKNTADIVFTTNSNYNTFSYFKVRLLFQNQVLPLYDIDSQSFNVKVL